MNGNDLVPLLGLTWDDERVKQFVASCGITKKPSRKRDSYDAYLVNKKLGLDITFTDEQDVEFRKTDYDEGTLVLSNITMYGGGSTMGYQPFGGELPHGLKLTFGLKEVQAHLGKKPNWSDKTTASARWDFKGYCLFIDFDKQHKEIRSLAVQLPVS